MQKHSIEHIVKIFEGVHDPTPLNRMRAHFIQSEKYSEAGDYERARRFHNYAFKELDHYAGTKFEELVAEAKLWTAILP